MSFRSLLQFFQYLLWLTTPVRDQTSKLLQTGYFHFPVFLFHPKQWVKFYKIQVQGCFGWTLRNSRRHLFSPENRAGSRTSTKTAMDCKSIRFCQLRNMAPHFFCNPGCKITVDETSEISLSPLINFIRAKSTSMASPKARVLFPASITNGLSTGFETGFTGIFEISDCALSDAQQKKLWLSLNSVCSFRIRKDRFSVFDKKV